MDWIVSNGGDDTLYLYLGNGDGTAQLPRIIPTSGVSPVDLIAVDVNGDQKVDLVVAEADSGAIGIMLGAGNGTFAAEILVQVPGSPQSLVAGDFDNDGKSDLVVGLITDNTVGPVALLLGDGAGNFTWSGPNPTQHQHAVLRVEAADLDGDGFLDLLVSDFHNTASGAQVYLNNGTGGFAKGHVVGGAPATLGDLTGDNCPDVVTFTLSLARVFFGHCNGTFDSVDRIYGLGDVGFGLSLTDLNLDGYLDLVASGTHFVPTFPGSVPGNLLSIRLGLGDGSFAAPALFRGDPSAVDLVAADLNQDGFPEVLAANQDADSVSVFVNDGFADFGTPRGAYVGLHDGTGSGGPVNPARTGLILTDADGDGDLDVAVLNSTFSGLPNELFVVFNDGTGIFSPPVRTPVFTQSVNFGDIVMADFRNTGRPDMLAVAQYFSSFSTGGPFWAFAPNIGGGQFGATTVVQTPGVQGELGVGDFNRDGRLDFVLAGPASGNVPPHRLTFFAGNGDGTFNQGSVVDFGRNAFTAPRSVHVADFNRDGHLDVLIWVNDSSDPTLQDLFQFLGNGMGGFTARTLFQGFLPFALGDLNGDGWPDLVEVNSLTNPLPSALPTVKIYIGQADGTFQFTQSYAPYAGESLIPLVSGTTAVNKGDGPLVADFNGDGHVDVAVMQLNPRRTSYVQFLIGRGDGTFEPGFARFDFLRPNAPQFTADVTGDGCNDLLQMDTQGASFQVLPGSRAPSIQILFLQHPLLGSAGNVRVVLNRTAAANTTVLLSASDPSITLPAVIQISAGSNSGDFSFNLGAGFSSSVFFIEATLGAETARAYGHVASGTALTGIGLTAVGPFLSTGPADIAATDLNVFSVGGYSSDSVVLGCASLPNGVTCQFDQTGFALPADTGRFVKLTVSTGAGTPFGVHNLVLTACDTQTCSQVPITLSVGDFTIALTPASVTSLPTGIVQYTLATTALFNYQGGVTLQCSGLPAGASCALDGSLFPSFATGGFAVNLNSVAPGNYTLIVTGTSGILVHTASTELRISDFTATTPSTSATVSVGQSARFTFTSVSQNGFSDQLTFSCQGVPVGLSCAFNPASGLLPSNGSLTTELTVTVNVRPTAVPREPHFPAPMGFQWFLICAIALQVWYGIAVLKLRRPQVATPALLTVLAFVFLASCGGGSSAPPSPPPSSPPVTVNFVVVASSPSTTKVVANISLTVR